ncbi:MAG: hypothetical protein ACK5WH_07170 [Hyphomonadaceae bacterium]
MSTRSLLSVSVCLMLITSGCDISQTNNSVTWTKAGQSHDREKLKSEEPLDLNAARELGLPNRVTEPEIHDVLGDVTGEASINYRQTEPADTYVSGRPQKAPDGTYVGGRPQMAPDGTYVSGRPQMAPDGTYVGGRP